MVSHNPNDVRERYCGHCHAFHDDMVRKVLPPDNPRAPKYWIHETSGVLEPVVRAYLNGDQLTTQQLILMRAYLYQWVSAPVWAPSGALEELRLRVAAAQSNEDIDLCIEAAVAMGMDPL
jgi:hypothetical protein